MTNNAIYYKDIDSTNITSENIKFFNFKIDNIKLLEKPYISNINNYDYTILNIILNNNLKKFLSSISKIINNPISFYYKNNVDYYQLIINRNLPELVKQLDINENYDIEINICDCNNILWKIFSIEINENNNVIQNIEQDDYIDDYEPDYEDLQNTYINKINKRINHIDIKIEKLIRKKNKHLEILEEIKNKFKFSKINDYQNLIYKD